MLLALLVGFFVVEPLGIPISAIATACALVLYVIAAKGHAINTSKVPAAFVASRDLFAGHVPGGVWLEERRTD